jgi:hypothetical protein
MTTINWDRSMLDRFSSKVERLLREGCDRNETFVFDGNTFVIAYAIYLIEYLEERIK